jgi:arylsulfatase A
MNIHKALPIIGISLLTTIPNAVQAKTQGAHPNFVFILIDDMGWTGSSVQLNKKLKDSKSDFYLTPNMEKLAKQGVRFSNAYSPAALCTPSRGSILTGKSPAQLHITTPGPGRRRTPSWHKLIQPKHINSLPTKETTLAELLKQKNYATAHFGKWHLSGGGPGKHGFDQHDGETGNGGPGKYKDPNPKDIFKLTQRANAFMEKNVKNGKPFYVQLSHFAVHSPHEALSKTIASCSKRKDGKYHNNDKYAAMTQDLDTSIGQVLDKIKKLGIEKNTYVILMSDNGAGIRNSRNENAPLSGGKGTLWEGGVRVPLIICGPGVKANVSQTANVIGYDLFPTVCELAGVKSLPRNIEGISLVPLLTGKKDDFANRQMIFHYPHYGRGPRQKPQSALIEGRYKLLKDLETGQVKLFDLTKDIGEKNDLTKSNPTLSAEMHNKLKAYLKKVKAQQPTKNSNYKP